MIGVLVFDEKGLEVVPDAVVHLLVLVEDVGKVVALFHRLLRPFHILPACHVPSCAKRQANRQSKAPKNQFNSLVFNILPFSLSLYIEREKERDIHIYTHTHHPRCKRVGIGIKEYDTYDKKNSVVLRLRV